MNSSTVARQAAMRFAPLNIRNAIRDLEGIEADIKGMVRQKNERVRDVLAEMSGQGGHDEQTAIRVGIGD